MFRIGALVAVFVFPLMTPPDCSWTRPVDIGRLPSPIGEASGLAASRRFPGRLYHVNDSGDSGRFFVTDYSGGLLKTVRVAGMPARDVEDLSLGPCGLAVECLFLADIGDNDRVRNEIEVVAVSETLHFGPLVQPLFRVRLRYPGAAYNAESFAVHPDGTFYILTKGGTPRLFRLTKAQWMQSNGQLQTLEPVAAIDFEKLGGPAAALDGRLPTAMDISADGKRFLVLTYRNAFEVFWDLSKPIPPPSEWVAGRDYRLLSIEALPQQEAIAYLPDGKSLIYDSEKSGPGGARLLRCDCR